MNTLTYHDIFDSTVESDMSTAFEAALGKARGDAPHEVAHRIAGQRVEIGERFDRADPARPDQIASRGFEGGREAVDRAIDAARTALPAWRRTSLGERIEAIARVRDVVAQRAYELAALSALETGKPRADALAEVHECTTVIDVYLEQIRATGAIGVSMAPPPGGQADIVLKPYGVFGVIAPFNFPFAITITMAIPALLLGNTVVLKPSAITPACGDAMAAVIEAAELPVGVFNSVQGGAATGEALTDSDVDGIAFTGSADVGLEMAARLRRPPYSRPLMAEMGGKSPTIVSAATADVAAAAKAVARSAFGMTAQKCNACSRAIVSSEIHDDFVAALVEETSQMTLGDPMDPTSFCGPLVTEVAFARFGEVVEEAKAGGATLACGGGTKGEGWYPELTVATGLPAGHRLLRDELFVPVLTVRPYDSFDDALREANDVRFGLSSGLFSDDADEQVRFADGIEAGIVFINNPGGGTTGVWPGSQSMAGWKASGSTGKGGFGPWYLTQFGREQSITRFGSALSLDVQP
ncbi:MAG: aldehyde dehydrogenase family protein [Actinobacteria bacterium]|nr:aldehyde dehydrogenase family protein [Actinomycetota bacterium]